MRTFAAVLLSVFASSTSAPAAGPQTAVRVIVDMDPSMPGVQSHLEIAPGTARVDGIAVYVVDPVGGRTIRGIGYLGGIDRGIAFGHTPSNGHQGTVVAMDGRPEQPVGAEGSAGVLPDWFVDKGFDGPEVQYVEFGVDDSPLPTTLAAPLFTVDVELSGAQPGDVYDFHLLDFVTVWSGGQGGAFSTTGSITLDTGGDVVPDGTVTRYGTDPDGPIPVPPAAFPVDYVDGDGGPAVITVGPVVSAPPSGSTVSGIRFGAARPNPFRSATSFTFALDEARAVTIDVYDVVGRKIRTLAAGMHGAGIHVVDWHGGDAAGRPLAPGTYWVRLSSGGETLTRRAIKFD